jgi:hypothetical protein
MAEVELKTSQQPPSQDNRGNKMSAPIPTPPKIPQEVAEYLRGPSGINRQFDFLLGTWSVSASRYGPDGSQVGSYLAKWIAQVLDGGRMVMDDFRALSPDGKEVSSYVTLRTYSERTARWEMAGLAALQPAVQATWYGVWRDGEMHLDAAGQGPNGQPVRTRIRFYAIGKRSFQWESSSSVDDGKTWFITAKLNATRD